MSASEFWEKNWHLWCWGTHENQRDAATQAAVTHYDHARIDHSEHSARRIAALYLRRKVPGTDELVALEWLADELARRAASKLQTAQAAIIQGRQS